MFDNFKADLNVYCDANKGTWFVNLLRTQGLWAIAEYRYSNWVRYNIKYKLVKAIFKSIGF